MNVGLEEIKLMSNKTYDETRVWRQNPVSGNCSWNLERWKP